MNMDVEVIVDPFVLTANLRTKHLQDIQHVPEFERSEIQRFFEVCKDLEPGMMVAAGR